MTLCVLLHVLLFVLVGLSVLGVVVLVPRCPLLGQRMSKVRRVNKGGTTHSEPQTSLGLRRQLDTLNVSTASSF